MKSHATHARLKKNALRLIEDLRLDLSGLTVYTEAASGSYLASPVLAALAGAQVVAQARDSRYGMASDVIANTQALADFCGVADRITYTASRDHAALGQADIVTNSGFVRPIDKDLIGALKPTAVIPLMWETWEFRSSDFDLEYCKAQDILTLGTNEHHPDCNMMPVCGHLALKLIYELGYEGFGTRVLVLGNSPSPGKVIAEQLRALEMDVVWFSSTDESDYRYEDLQAYFDKEGKRVDVILLAEHMHGHKLLGEGGYLDLGAVAQLNPELAIGVIAGNVDGAELAASGLHYYPTLIQPFGFMTYQPYALGEYPVLLLYAGGLKVGEAMARARLSGMPVASACQVALDNSPAMDFIGGDAWLKV